MAIERSPHWWDQADTTLIGRKQLTANPLRATFSFCKILFSVYMIMSDNIFSSHSLLIEGYNLAHVSAIMQGNTRYQLLQNCTHYKSGTLLWRVSGTLWVLGKSPFITIQNYGTYIIYDINNKTHFLCRSLSSSASLPDPDSVSEATKVTNLIRTIILLFRDFSGVSEVSE